MNPEIPLTKEILSGISRIDQHREFWRSGRPVSSTRLDALSSNARVQSTAAACRLSGLKLTDQQVGEVLAAEGLRSADHQLVHGYARALDASVLTPTKRLVPEDLARLHGYACAAEAASAWRGTPLVREAFDASGRATGRVFSTLSPRQIEPQLHALSTWLEDELRHPARHPIPSIAVFSLGLLAASPFETGNGRVMFLALGHLLQRAGYRHIPYASIEAQIEDLRDEFQASFDSAQTRFWGGQALVQPWIEFIVRVLDRHRERVDIKVALEQRTLSFPPLQQAILEAVREHGTVGAGLLLEATGANRNTLKDNLRKMVDHGVLQKHGERRGTLYQLATPGPHGAKTLD